MSICTMNLTLYYTYYTEQVINLKKKIFFDKHIAFAGVVLLCKDQDAIQHFAY